MSFYAGILSQWKSLGAKSKSISGTSARKFSRPPNMACPQLGKSVSEWTHVRMHRHTQTRAHTHATELKSFSVTVQLLQTTVGVVSCEHVRLGVHGCVYLCIVRCHRVWYVQFNSVGFVSFLVNCAVCKSLNIWKASVTASNL